MDRGKDKPSEKNTAVLFIMKSYYPTAGAIVLLPYEKILSSPVRPPEEYSEEALSQLVMSIQENGILEPILVSVIDEQYYKIVSGERRFRAAMTAGLPEIPCIVVKNAAGNAVVPFSLINEIHHSRIHYLDQAAQIRRWLEEEASNLYRLSEILCVPMAELSERLRLLNLSEEIRTEIKKNGISETYARLLLKAEEQQRIDVLEQIVSADLSLTETKAYIDKLREKKKRGNIMIFKDLNVFINTLEHAVETMKRSGIEASAEREETDERITYTVKISKTG